MSDPTRDAASSNPAVSPPPIRAAGPGVPPSPARGPAPMYVMAPPRRGLLGRILIGLLGLLFVGSLAMNLVLLVIVAGTVAGPFEVTEVSGGKRDQQVAVYEIAGLIDDGQAQDFRQFVRQVEADGNIKAVVLRVNTPGGGVSASDEMHAAVQELMATGRPVVVSMGGIAASGGYYVAAPASKIFAEPTTLTGSIGVIIQYPILQGTLEKIGLEMQTIKSTSANDWKDMLSPFRQPEEREIEYMRGLVDQMHARFVDVVAAGRSGVMTREQAQELANGMIWTGPQAKQNKLVDDIGYLDDACASAASLAGLSQPRVMRYARRMSLFQAMGARSEGVTIDPKLIDEIQTPRMMLLWRAE